MPTKTANANNAQITANIISTNPRVCYRNLCGLVRNAIRDQGFDETEHLIAAARPDCGYDCDEVCPVSGKAEG